MEFLWIIIGVVSEITFGLMVLIAIKGLYEDSLVLDKKVIIPFALCGILSVGKTYIDSIAENTKVYDFLSILYCIIWLLLILRGNKKRIYQRIRSVIEVIIILGFSMIGYIGSGFALIYKTSFLEADIYFERWIDILVIVLEIIISVVLYRELIRKGICIQFKFGERLILLTMTMFAFIIYCIVELMLENNENTWVIGDIPIRIILFLLLSVSYITIPFLMMKNKLTAYYEIGQRHQQEINVLEVEYFRQYKASQEETRAFRHDIVNHLLTIQMLQNSEKSEEAREYVAELLGKMQSISPKFVTGCEILDCILSSKFERMNQSRIDFTINGVMDRGLQLKAIDICSIFANAIDNAIEACEKLENNRNIWMTIKKTASFYCITIENTFSDNRTKKHQYIFGENHFTTKKNKELHGYGIENIKKTVDQNNGEMKLEIKDDRFVMTILLPIPVI